MIDAGEAFFEFDRFRTIFEMYNGQIPLLWAVENVSIYHQFISQYSAIHFFLVSNINWKYYIYSHLETEPTIFDIKDGKKCINSRLV